MGANQKPLLGISQGALHISAPSDFPALVNSLIFANWAAELMAPISVFLSSGSPNRRVFIRSYSRFKKSSEIDSCKSNLDPAQHTCP